MLVGLTEAASKPDPRLQILTFSLETGKLHYTGMQRNERKSNPGIEKKKGNFYSPYWLSRSVSIFLGCQEHKC